MEILDILLSRRSIRKYEDKEVGEDLITKILEAAMYAPSAVNSQDWEFIVIKDKEIKNKIPDFSPYAHMVAKAPIAILVCGNLKEEKIPGFWVQNCAAATQNILLAAHSLGLGAVWIGIYSMQDRVDGFKKLFNLPENIIPFALIPIGYPAEKPTKPDRFNQNKIHYNKW